MKHFLQSQCKIELDENFKQQTFETLGFYITKLATYPIPCDNFIYMYEVYDMRCEDCEYFIVNHLSHRNDDGTPKRSLVYDPMQADNSFDAFREFIVEAEKHAF